MFFVFSAIWVACQFGVAAHGEDLANLTGRFVYDGKAPQPKTIEATKDPEVCGLHKLYDESLVLGEEGGVANAVVMLKTKNPKVAASYAATVNDKVVLDNKNCRFEPHVAVILTSQTMELTNSDPIGHNSNVSPALNPQINPILAAGGAPVAYKFATEEGAPVKVGCNIHPWMGAWLIARKDPYAAVSDSSGRFAIKDLPVGAELEFALWQEAAGNLKDVKYNGGKADSKGRFKIKLKPGDNNLGDIKLSPSLFKK
jgi:plastocyanin